MSNSIPTDTGQRCLECDYNLTAITADRCPECGWNINWNLVELAGEPEPVNPIQSMLVVLGVFCGVGSVMVAGWLFPTASNTAPVTQLYPFFTAIVGAIHIALLVTAVLKTRSDSNPLKVIKVSAVLAAIVQIILAILFAVDLQPNQSFFSYAILSFFTSLPGTTLIFATSISLPARQERKRRLEMRLKRQTNNQSPPPHFVIEFMTTYDEGTLRVVHKNIPRTIEPAVESAIEKTWTEKQREAKTTGRKLHNGQLARLVHWTACDNAAKLTVADTDYITFLGTNLHNTHLLESYSPDCFANAVGTSAIVITKDGGLLMGRRSNRVAYHAGYLHTIGGMLEKEDRVDDEYEAFAAIKREIREELKLTDDEITEVQCTGLVRDVQIMQPELIFDARVNLTLADIRSRFNADTDEEHTALEAVRDDPEAIVPFIDNADPITPVTVAALMLHGRLMWGETWYENTAYVLLGDLPVIQPIAKINN